MKKFIRTLAPVFVLVAGFLIMQGLVAAKPEPEKNDEEIRKLSLYVDSVRSESVRVGVRTQGEVRPKMEIDLIPQVSGRIVAISEQFSDGAEVMPNSLLAKIDDADYQVALVRAEARVAEAQTALERELATAEIKQEEWRDNPRKEQEATDFALNLTQVSQARAQLRAARADLDKARLDLARTEIRVPFHGRVRERNVGIGQFVTAGMPMGRVFSIDTVEVRLPLTDTQLVELNLPLGFTADNLATAPTVQFSASLGSREYSWTGQIVRIDASIDEDTRLIYATAEVQSPYGMAASGGMPMAVGLFVALMPIPLQMAVAAAIAILVRSNLPISVSLVWLTNPVHCRIIRTPASCGKILMYLPAMAQVVPREFFMLVEGTKSSFSAPPINSPRAD